MTLNVIGAGFGRTGTASLKRALEILGLGRCYHMTEVFARPQHAVTWQRACQGEPVDWHRLFQGYGAAVDWPASAFYPALMDAYPHAKVILTVREPERWYASVMQTIYPAVHDFPVAWLRHITPGLRQVTKMQDCVIWDGIFHGQATDKAYALSVYQRHIETVMRVGAGRATVDLRCAPGMGAAVHLPGRGSAGTAISACQRQRLLPTAYSNGANGDGGGGSCCPMGRVVGMATT